MERIKNILRDIDLFGITIGFRFDSRKRYQSALGGFFLILFAIILIVFGIYYFIPFFKRKNYTIVYYIMNLASSEEVDLFSEETNYAFGLVCDDSDKEKLKIEDLLDLKMRYIIYTKRTDGTYDKVPQDIETHTCTYSDFYNKYNDQMDYLGLTSFQCINNKNYIIQGIFSDQIFSYFEVSILSKNTSEELLNEIERYLYHNDCKLNIAFIDMIINLDDYKNPITKYVNDEIFVQLNPALYVKTNIYFMNQEFTNDNYLFFLIGDESPQKNSIYSWEEEYALWKGFNRSLTKVFSYNYFAKTYIRADIRKTVINRRYQKFSEYFANTFSLLTGIYEVLSVFFYFIYHFSSYHFLSKKIFFFKEVENKDNFDIHKKIRQIEELFNITDINISLNEVKQKGYKLNNNSTTFKKGKINNKEESEKEINIYNNPKNKLEKQLKYSSFSSLKNGELNINNKNNTKDSSYQRQYNERSKSKFNENVPKLNMNLSTKKKKYENSRIKKNSYRYSIYSSESLGTNTENSSSEYEKPKKKKREEYSFNPCEIIFFIICKCCLPKNFSMKNDINEIASNILAKKMDIITYVRNMTLFENINKFVIDDDKIPILNFLCRPIISLNKDEKSRFDELYRTYRDKDFNKFQNKICELVQKSKGKDLETRLIYLTHEHMKKCF